jgi:predicted DNA-binding transcriptional regulator AlpA
MAYMLDCSTSKFHQMVSANLLPQPAKKANLVRWNSLDVLEAFARISSSNRGEDDEEKGKIRALA